MTASFEKITLKADALRQNREDPAFAIRAKNKMKIGIIRCQKTADICRCPCAADLKIEAEGKSSAEGKSPVEIIGFFSCGGCPGKQAVPRAKILVERGAQEIVFASSAPQGKPGKTSCSHRKEVKETVIRNIGDGVRIIEWDH
ncbi:MAG TPA: CGGC domain-containing protein [Verrucomicrobiota bacterium]|nr:CGGC domain-containing protein [Verrucomicrobiota bacterium]